ncbi:MAG: hypothetical protein AB7P04_02850 [Bacteriovoracia bacterium]
MTFNQALVVGGLLVAAVFSAGCNNATGDQQGQASYNYLLCENCSKPDGSGCQTDQAQCGGGCTTGQHSYNSKVDYCNGLNNRAANNNCATGPRQTQFEQAGCAGSFTNN